MKLDKEQQKHFAEAIRNASKKKGFKVKGCSIYDDIFWKVLQMPSNSKQADSLRAVGAFKAPSILIEKGQDIKQELLHRYKTILPFFINFSIHCISSNVYSPLLSSSSNFSNCSCASFL